MPLRVGTAQENMTDESKSFPPEEPRNPLEGKDSSGLFLLLGSRVARGFAAGLVNVAFPYLVLTDLHADYFLLGLLYVGGSLSTAILTYLFGRTGTRVNLRATYLIALALLPMACLLLLFRPNLALVALASVLGGFSATGSLAGGGVGGMVMPMQTAILADLTPRRDRTRWFSYFTFLTGASAAVGTLAAGTGTLTEVFLLAFVLALAALFLALPIRIRRVVQGKSPSKKSQEVIRKFTYTGILNGFSQGLLTPFLIPYFILVFGIARPQMSVYSGIAGAAGTVSVLFAPYLDRRWGFVQAIVGTRIVAALLAVSIPFLSLVPALIAYMALPSFRVAALPAQSSALVSNLPPQDRAEGAGTNQAARVGASSAATAVAGYSLADVAVAIPFVGYAAALAVNSYLYVHFFGWKGSRISTADSASP